MVSGNDLKKLKGEDIVLIDQDNIFKCMLTKIYEKNKAFQVICDRNLEYNRRRNTNTSIVYNYVNVGKIVGNKVYINLD